MFRTLQPTMSELTQDTTEMSVAGRLKQLRRRAGLSVRALAERIGEPHSTYASYEDRYKKRYIPVELVEKLAPVLVGLGDPPITADEVYALSGLPAMPPHVTTTGELLSQLAEIDRISIRAMRQFIATLPDAPEQIRDYDRRAEELRATLRQRFS